MQLNDFINAALSKREPNVWEYGEINKWTIDRARVMVGIGLEPETVFSQLRDCYGPDEIVTNRWLRFVIKMIQENKL